MVKLRETLMSYDTSKTPQEKQACLNRLKDHCAWDHSYTKPTNLKKIKKNEEVIGGDDTSEEEDEELRKYDSKFKQEEEFNRTLLVENFVANQNAQSIHPVRYFIIMILEILPYDGLLKDDCELEAV